ncbi:hypothetical protein FXF51_35170 [Nonomuraea sp. PA05]|uniref:hypothetical protein n=1 Tax=Nonomuraea sp. PA05 TaxID=2604466 RepID=UPI0011D45A2F|nr:hypothetical protein [Nonomuraea sp. PA05]TYB59214.1 hypothetical protein FXF51_35170 [Nonomuraea sp. PA05]
MTPDDTWEIHAPSLRAAGQGLHGAVEQLVAHWTSLGRALDELQPKMVGEDLVSQLIGGSFQGIRETADDTLRSVMAGLAGHGEKVLRAEANASGAETAVAQQVASIRTP